MLMSIESKEKEYKGPMSLEKITSHEPTVVKRDPEDIKEGIAETPEESKERLTRSDMTKGSDKA
jgi:hypothetical protein